MSNRITGAEIFDTGNWNGRPFTDEDLNGIVDTFNVLGLSGRVPLKFGHSGTDARTNDGDPALGWIEKVYRKGSKLVADITDVPTVVYDAIKKGLYKFVSIELLKDLKAGTQTIPWVLDAVALLGATRPAVGHLKDLQALAMSRRLSFDGERVTFSRQESTMTDELETLKAENATLNARLVDATFTNAITAGRILPNVREAFKRLHPDGTPDEAAAFIASAPKAPAMTTRPTTFSRGSTAVAGERSDVTLARLAEEEANTAAAAGRPYAPDRGVALERAARVVMSREPALATKYQHEPDGGRK
jgi:hypothetical protein